jgi:hypothetical protein
MTFHGRGALKEARRRPEFHRVPIIRRRWTSPDGPPFLAGLELPHQDNEPAVAGCLISSASLHVLFHQLASSAWTEARTQLPFSST